jgi:hypothetical protein
MSNLIVNVRFGLWHFQIRRDRPWFGLSRNDYHAKGLERGDTPIIEIYAPFHLAIGGR